MPEKATSLELIRHIETDVKYGIGATKSYTLAKGTTYGRRKKVYLALYREIAEKEKVRAVTRFIPTKYKLKIYAYRDFILDEEGESYGHGCNLYFFMKNPKTTDFDWMNDIREFFIKEIEKSTFGMTGMHYERSDISVAEPDDISIPIGESNTQQFVFEIGMLKSESFQYYGHFIKGWKLFYVWDGFNKKELERLLRKKL